MGNEQKDRERRRKRRSRRIQIIVIYTAIAVGLAWFFESQATTTVIFVRHAEKAALPADDPGLSDAGRRRVAELTRQLVDADVVAGIDAVYVTPTRRSMETGQPVATRLGLDLEQYDPADNEAVLGRILKENKGRIVLVVAHSNTVPTLIADLGAVRMCRQSTKTSTTIFTWSPFPGLARPKPYDSVLANLTTPTGRLTEIRPFPIRQDRPVSEPERLARPRASRSMFKQESLTVQTQGRGTYDLSRDIERHVANSGITTGICQVFIRHTSASLMLCENADPAVMRDLETFMSRLTPDGDAMFTHTAEGPDDMPAHVRSVLTQTDLNLPISSGRCALGTWQGRLSVGAPACATHASDRGNQSRRVMLRHCRRFERVSRSPL